MTTYFVLVLLLQVNPVIFGTVAIYPTEDSCNKAMTQAVKENEDSSTSFTCLEWVKHKTDKQEVKPVQKKEAPTPKLIMT